MFRSCAKYGLYIGLVSAVILVLLWQIDKSYLIDFKIDLFISTVIPAIFMLLAGKSFRSAQEGQASFGELMQPTFTTYIIGSGLTILFTFLLFTIIDPEIMTLQAQQSYENAYQTAEKMSNISGANEEAMNKFKSEMEANKEEILAQTENAGIGTFILSWIIKLIMPGIFLALIISAILKNLRSS